MRFVHDDQVPRNPTGDFQVRRLFDRVQAGNDAGILAPELFPIGAERGVIRRGCGEVEFVAQFLLPLIHERGHGEDEKAFDHAARKPFFERQAGFDGFAQAHFIREQRASAQRTHRAQGGAHLVIEPLNPAIGQCD